MGLRLVKGADSLGEPTALVQIQMRAHLRYASLSVSCRPSNALSAQIILSSVSLVTRITTRPAPTQCHKEFNASGGCVCAAACPLLHDPPHQLYWLHAQAISDFYEFKYVNASFARLNFPDERIASPELRGQLPLREISCFTCFDDRGDHRTVP
jgi:hypothetical protein